MTTEPSPPTNEAGPPRGGGSSGVVALLLIVVSAAAVFAAGLSLGSQTGGRDAAERAAVEAFVETYRRINDDFVGEARPDELLEGAIEGMFDTLDDPYSAYMGPDTYNATLDSISGEFEGVGARMGAENASGVACEPIGEDCLLRVTEVLAGSPALEAGLEENDVVRAVDDISLDGQTIDDAVRLIRGPRATEVTLTLDRDGTDLALVIVRDVITSQDVRSAVLADGAVGYLRVDAFSSSASDDFAAALKAHLDAGIKRLVVDLRGDPGGFVDTAVDISSQFLASGPVFWEEAADGTQRPIEVRDGGLATDASIEVAVLVDDGSASASEILAGALQDAGRAMLVGEPTFGKGTVQEWTRLPGDSGGFRLSVAKWLTRDKRWVDGTGLAPDVLVTDSGARFRPGGDGRGSDGQLARAVALLLGEDGVADGDGVAIEDGAASPNSEATATPSSEAGPAPSQAGPGADAPSSPTPVS